MHPLRNSNVKKPRRGFGDKTLRNHGEPLAAVGGDMVNFESRTTSPASSVLTVHTVGSLQVCPLHPGTDHTRTHTRLKTAIFSLRHARGASPPPLAPGATSTRATTARPGGTGAAAHPPDAPGPPASALGGFTSASGPSAPPSRRAAAARPRSGRRTTYAALKSRLEAPPASGQLACHAPRAAAAPGPPWKSYAGR